MVNYWKLKKENEIVILSENMIYKGTLELSFSDRYNSNKIELKDLKNIFSIPFSYIRKVENQENNNTLHIYFGSDSVEEFTFENEDVKNMFFESLKKEATKLVYDSKIPSKFNYAKSQFFALGITSILYLWSLYLAIQIENGVEYKIIGGGNPGISGIVLGIAQFGSIKISIAFICILVLIIYSLQKRLKTRSETEYLTR